MPIKIGRVSGIRMRHAARAPPPPYLELGDWCSWLHSANCKLSIRVLVSAFSFAFVLCIFLQISVCSWCLLSIRFVSGDVGNLQILLQKCVRNASTIMQQSIKSHAKSIQNRRKWCQGALRKRPWEQVGSRLLKKALHLFINLRLLAPLGRFWAPFWPQLGAKGVPKSSIWASRRAQSRKNSLQEEV